MSTPLLPHAVSAETQHAFEDLVEVTYEELRRIAHYHILRENPGHTLPPTAIVHEAYMRLSTQDKLRETNRAHFIAIASQMIRRVLVDYARRRGSLKRGRHWNRVTLQGASIDGELSSLDLITLNDGLEELQAVEPRLAQVVELRFFGGMSITETAHALQVSPRTVNNDWRYARAWLQRRLGDSPGPSEDLERHEA